jgi:hypothetical protein
VFKNSQIKMVDVPHFAELAATKVFEEVKRNKKFQLYLPEFELLKRPMNRQYLFNVSDFHHLHQPFATPSLF